LETNLIDRKTRVAYQKKIASVNKLMEINSLVSMLAAVSEIKEIDKIKKDNLINYQNLYLRNVNRFETVKDDFSRVKSYLAIKEKEVLDLQFKDIEKLLNSESYERFDTASDILDLVEDKFKVAVSGKKDRITTYLTTEVDGLKGYVWEEDLQVIREGSEFVIAEAQKSNDFNNLNLDKFKKDEKINSKKKTIDDFIKYLIDSSSDTKKEHKAKLARIIKQSETFYRRDVSLKKFEEFTKDSKYMLDGNTSKSKPESKSRISSLLRWAVLALISIISIFLFMVNASNSKDYNLKKGKKYLNYVSSVAKFSRKSGASLSKNKIRKRIFAAKEDLQILNLTDSTVTINYKGNILKADF
ncbi:MAG: hypothetical protein GQ534_08105, partial [Candidatus Delongbacteria bacterium]|nr:hypothetical protein [Candidatus Delongbacteria bacterium]